MLRYIICFLGVSLLFIFFIKNKLYKYIEFIVKLALTFLHRKKINAILSDNHKYITVDIVINGKDIETVILPTYEGLNKYIIKAWKIDENNHSEKICLLRYNNVYLNLELSPKILGVQCIHVMICDRLSHKEVVSRFISNDATILDVVNRLINTEKNDYIHQNKVLCHRNSSPVDEADSQE
jgi:hypothetical protein